MSDIITVIPARLGATRLPNKPLADIAGIPMVIRVAQQAAQVGEVLIACAEEEIAKVARAYGFNAIITDPALPSGTDRVYAAVRATGRNYSYIVNVQGDLPFIAPSTIAAVAECIKRGGCDVATAAALITEESQIDDPNVVKVVLAASGQALYFSRARAPYGNGAYYHHVGLYAYTAAALEKFVSLPPSPLEQRERLEQLRVMESGGKIKVELVHDIPISVDTPQDLERARQAAVS